MMIDHQPVFNLLTSSACISSTIVFTATAILVRFALTVEAIFECQWSATDIGQVMLSYKVGQTKLTVYSSCGSCTGNLRLKRLSQGRKLLKTFPILNMSRSGTVTFQIIHTTFSKF